MKSKLTQVLCIISVAFMLIGCPQPSDSGGSGNVETFEISNIEFYTSGGDQIDDSTSPSSDDLSSTFDFDTTFIKSLGSKTWDEGYGWLWYSLNSNRNVSKTVRDQLISDIEALSNTQYTFVANYDNKNYSIRVTVSVTAGVEPNEPTIDIAEIDFVDDRDYSLSSITLPEWEDVRLDILSELTSALNTAFGITAWDSSDNPINIESSSRTITEDEYNTLFASLQNLNVAYYAFMPTLTTDSYGLNKVISVYTSIKTGYKYIEKIEFLNKFGNGVYSDWDIISGDAMLREALNTAFGNGSYSKDTYDTLFNIDENNIIADSSVAAILSSLNSLLGSNNSAQYDADENIIVVTIDDSLY